MKAEGEKEMEHKTYTYENSRKLFERALPGDPFRRVRPSGPAEGCFIPVDAFPFFSERAQGTYFWDVDGNRFIDYMCAYGPNILGYGDPDVDEAARKQREKEDCVIRALGCDDRFCRAARRNR